MKRYYLISLFISLIFTVPGYTEDKMTMAVLDLIPTGVSPEIANVISNIIRMEFTNISNFIVVERAQIEAVIDEQKFQMSGFIDSAYAVEIGKLLSARRIIVGEVNMLVKAAVITLRYIDVETGISLFSAREKFTSLDDADKAAEKIAKDLSDRIVSRDKDIITPRTLNGYYARSLVPGLAQIYTGKSTKGYIFLASSILSGALMGYTLYDFNKKRSAYEDVPDGSSVNTYNEMYEESSDAAIRAGVSVSLFALIYAVNILDVFVFSRGDLNNYIDKNENLGFSNIYLDVEPYKEGTIKSVTIGYIKRF